MLRSRLGSRLSEGGLSLVGDLGRGAACADDGVIVASERVARIGKVGRVERFVCVERAGIVVERPAAADLAFCRAEPALGCRRWLCAEKKGLQRLCSFLFRPKLL